MTKFVFHHIDNDGFLAGYLAGKHLGGEIVYLPINYGKDLFQLAERYGGIRGGDIVWIVDFSIPPSDMDRLLSITGHVVWIDHHASSIEEYAGYEKEIAGVRYDGMAACMLTWLYVNGYQKMDRNALNAASSAPRFIRLVAEHDIWRFDRENDVMEFYYGTGIEETRPFKSDNIWEALDDGSLDEEELILNGEIIAAVKDADARVGARKGFPAVLDGELVFALNKFGVSSEDFKFVYHQERYSMFVGFYFDGQEYKYSLRAVEEDGFDCAAAAAKHGGGGHHDAAGFSSDELVLVPLSRVLTEGGDVFRTTGQRVTVYSPRGQQVYIYVWDLVDGVAQRSNRVRMVTDQDEDYAVVIKALLKGIPLTEEHLGAKIGSAPAAGIISSLNQL